MTKNSGKKREIEARRARIAELYNQGIEDPYKLAEIIGVTYQTIRRDLIELTKRWQQSALINIDLVKSRKLQELAEIKRKNWEAWNRSIEECKTRTVKAKGDRGGKGKDKTDPQIIEQINKTEERCGDPRYMGNLIDAIKEECKILGLYAPEKKEHTGKDGGPIQVETQRAAVLERLKNNPELAKRLKDAVRSKQ